MLKFKFELSKRIDSAKYSKYVRLVLKSLRTPLTHPPTRSYLSSFTE